MGKTSGPKTRAMIIFEAFKLFSTKQYDNVTYSDFERETGMTRGSILYHFPSKQNLFEAVIENLLFNRATILDIPIRDGDILKSFIGDFIKNCEKSIKTMAGHGIKNINLAYYIIESSAFCFFDNFGKRSLQIRDTELGVWTQVVRMAMDKKEIMDTMKPEDIATLFLNLYFGHAYAATKEEKVCDTQRLHKEFFTLYELVKKS